MILIRIVATVTPLTTTLTLSRERKRFLRQLEMFLRLGSELRPALESLLQKWFRNQKEKSLNW